jgi:hypothetical protein
VMLWVNHIVPTKFTWCIHYVEGRAGGVMETAEFVILVVLLRFDGS